MGSLATQDVKRLAACEATIEKGMSTFVEVGQALAEIRDSKLYRETHKTFQAYCKERWSMARSRAYQLIEAAVVVENLSTTVDKTDDMFPPVNEAQVRELSRVAPEKQPEVWREASKNGTPTAAKVTEAAKKVVGEDGIIRTVSTDKRCTPIPPKLAPVFTDGPRRIRGLVKKIGELLNEIEQDSTPGLERLPLAEIRDNLKNAQAALTSAIPTYVCTCKGRGCKTCSQMGWLHKHCGVVFTEPEFV